MLGMVATASAQPTSKPTTVPTGKPTSMPTTAKIDGYKMQVIRLGDAEGIDLRSPDVFTPDGRHCRYTKIVDQEHRYVSPHTPIKPGEPITTKQCVVVDGQVGPEFDRIDNLTFSPVSENMAYCAMKNGKWFVMTSGGEWPAHSSPHGTYCEIIFSPDGKRVACLANGSGTDQQFVVVDGKEGTERGLFVGGSMVFSPDSKRFAYAVTQESKKRAVAVIDGQVGPDYDAAAHIFKLAFSPDSKHVVYSAAKNEKGLIVLDGKEVKYDGIGISEVVFSPDSKKVAYLAFKNGKMVVVFDDKVGDEYDKIDFLTFSPDSKHLLYRATKGKEGTKDIKQVIVVDRKAGVEYDRISDNEYDPPKATMFFSPDGKRFAYKAFKGEMAVMVFDGQESKEYDYVGNPVFNSDGTHMAYIATIGKPKDIMLHNSGKTTVVMDGQEGKWYGYVSSLLFSPDGKHVAYVAAKRIDGKRFVAVDGKEGDEYGTIEGLVFSPDSKRFAYWVHRWEDAKAQWFVVVDGKTLVKYEKVDNYQHHCIWFSSDSKHVAYTGFKFNSKNRKGSQVVIIDGQSGPDFDIIGPAVVGLDDGGLEYLAIKENSLYRVKYTPD